MKRSGANSAHPLTGWTDQGAIVACTLADQQEKLTEHFLELFKNQQSTVVVSQSWSEIHKVNEQVRLGLKAQKLIGEAETTVTALERQDLTDAQKRDKRFYQPDSVLVFNRPTAGFKSGSAGKLRGITDKHLLIEADNRIRPVPFKELDKITVCQPKELSLSTGDRLQLKANAQSQDGRRLANGELVTVKEIHADGRIALNDGRVLPKTLPPVRARLCGHVLRRPGQNRGLRPVLRFRRQGRDE